MTAQPNRSLVFSVQGGRDAGAAARRAINTRNGWLSEALRDDILLLVTELVTNAVQHGEVDPDRSVSVGIHQSSEHVRVEVVDAGPGFHPDAPLPRGPAGGWGLYLVERIADRWGVLPAASGSCVWFELVDPHTGGALR
jgi:anti-sigma regulatory factor (Ser/Thr protein kinase)